MLNQLERVVDTTKRQASDAEQFGSVTTTLFEEVLTRSGMLESHCEALVKTITEVIETNRVLRAENADLRAENQDLREQIAALAGRVDALER